MSSLCSRRRLCVAAVILGAAIVPATASASDNPRVMRVDPTTGDATQIAAGANLLVLDSDRVETAGPGTPSVVSSGGLYDQYGVQPQYGALAGTTLYTTASSSCASAEGGGAYVIAVNTLTGAQTLTKRLGCRPLGGIAATPAGKLLIAQGGKPARVVQLDPQTGALTTVSSGGLLKQPRDLALDAAGDALVADATSGVVAVATQGGDQSPLTAKGVLAAATGIAVGPDNGIYVTDAGLPPRLRATASRRQRLRNGGLRISVACSRRCTVGYDVSVRIPGASGFAKDAAVRNVRARRTAALTLRGQVRRRIAAAVGRGRSVTATITATPQDPRTQAPGASTKLRVRIV